MSLHIECRSEIEYAGRPTALSLEGERLEITQILTEWRTPQGKCFRVRVQDGQVFELCYSEANDAWNLLLPAVSERKPLNSKFD